MSGFGPIQKPEVDSELVLKYLDILQSVISRMSANSASSKNWCITIVSGVLVFTTNSTTKHASWIAMVPVITFWIMDVYYLSFEKGTRDIYNTFVNRIHNDSVALSDLFVIRINWRSNAKSASFSFSILGFYVCVAVLVVAASVLLK